MRTIQALLKLTVLVLVFLLSSSLVSGEPSPGKSELATEATQDGQQDTQMNTCEKRREEPALSGLTMEQVRQINSPEVARQELERVNI